jgi:AcrR family transcriptional regulator
MGLRAKAKADKWERIRAAAKRLFTERGYEGTTIRAIAEEAGVATGTVLVYGETKDALLHELWRREAMPIVEEAVSSVPDGGFADRVMHLFGPLLAHYASHPELARVVVKELPFLTGAAAEAHRPALMTLLVALAGLVEQAKARGELRSDVEALAASELIFSLYYSALLRMLAPFSNASAAEAELALRSSLADLMKGIAPRRES